MMLHKRPSQLPLRWRLTLWYLLTLGIILISFATFLYFQLRANLFDQLDASLQLVASQIAISVEKTDQQLAFISENRSAETDFTIFLTAVDGTDALFMVAAVADFRPVNQSEHKIKKTKMEEWGQAIGLETTLDILSAVKTQREQTGFPRLTLGFAAETRDAYEYGRGKLLRKGLNFIAINDVTAPGAGFAVDTNRILLLGVDGVVEEMPLQSKTAVAERLVYHVAKALTN